MGLRCYSSSHERGYILAPFLCQAEAVIEPRQFFFIDAAAWYKDVDIIVTRAKMCQISGLANVKLSGAFSSVVWRLQA